MNFWYGLRLNLGFVLLVAALAGVPFFLAQAIWGPTIALVFETCLVLFAWLGRSVRRGLFNSLPKIQAFQAPELFDLIRSLVQKARLPRFPDVLLVERSEVNAAAAFDGHKPLLLLTFGLLKELDQKNLQAAIAHEVGHLKHKDLLLFRIGSHFLSATIVLAMTLMILLLFSSVGVEELLFWYLTAFLLVPLEFWLLSALSRNREFAADLEAARLTGDPQSLASALYLIELRPRRWLVWLPRRRAVDDAFRSHPATEKRIKRLMALGSLTPAGAPANLFL